MPEGTFVMLRHDKRDRIMMGIQEQEERVVHDDVAAGVFFFNRVSGQDKADRPHMSLPPVGLIHFLAVRMEPYDILDLTAMDLPPLKEAASSKHGMGLSERNELSDECMEGSISL